MPDGVDTDFDVALPSPLAAIRKLRADAQDAVVALGARTEAQGRTYVLSQLDTEITELARLDPPPHAIFVTGSAGGGKSGAAEHQRRQNPELFSEIVEDATHSDDPSEDQAATLARRLSLMSDTSERRPDRPLLVAANIGMILQLANTWKKQQAPFDALIAQLFRLLGLPGSPAIPRGSLPLDIRVLNLDDRPTTGAYGLLTGMLETLAPADSGATVFDQSRCSTCTAIAYCVGRTNAALISTVGKAGLTDLADRAAVVRGRQDTPRALWDYLSRVILPDNHYGDFGDPCLASQAASRRGDTLWVLQGLLPITIFKVDSDLGHRIAALDPSRQPTREAYDAFANAGLSPLEDAEQIRKLANNLRAEGYTEPTLDLIQRAILDGPVDEADEPQWRDSSARLQLGLKILHEDTFQTQSEKDLSFLRTLEAYRAWQASATANGQRTDNALIDDLGERIDGIVSALTAGLARLFGQRFDDKLFLPVQNYDPRQASRAFVEYDRRTMKSELVPDRVVTANPEGSLRIGYRPLAITLRLASGDVEIDLPTYSLLTTSRLNLIGGGEDAERTFALRRAAEGIARIAAEGEEVTMLVTHPLTRRRYRVTTEKSTISGNEILHAQAVRS